MSYVNLPSIINPNDTFCNIQVSDGSGLSTHIGNRPGLLGTISSLTTNSASITTFGDFAFENLEGTNGYQYLPSGILMQWSVFGLEGISSVTVTLPKSYTDSGTFFAQVSYRSVGIFGTYPPLIATPIDSNTVLISTSNGSSYSIINGFVFTIGN